MDYSPNSFLHVDTADNAIYRPVAQRSPLTKVIIAQVDLVKAFAADALKACERLETNFYIKVSNFKLYEYSRYYPYPFRRAKPT